MLIFTGKNLLEKACFQSQLLSFFLGGNSLPSLVEQCGINTNIFRLLSTQHGGQFSKHTFLIKRNFCSNLWPSALEFLLNNSFFFYLPPPVGYKGLFAHPLFKWRKGVARLLYILEALVWDICSILTWKLYLFLWASDEYTSSFHQFHNVRTWLKVNAK